MGSGTARWSVLAVLACTALHAAALSPVESFNLRVPVAPMARAMDGDQQLVYELHLDNHARRDLQPVSVQVMNVADGRVLATYEGPALEQRLDRSGVQWKADTFASIPSGRHGVVFIELALKDPLPKAVRHRVGFTSEGTAATIHTIEGGAVRVVEGTTPVLSPPLEGGPWVAIHDPRWARGHRRAGYALDGMLRTPGRYAADWVKLDAAGRKAPVGDERVARTFSHGQSVHAVGNGRVIRVHDHFPERTRVSDASTGSEGNSVVLQLDNGFYAHYGHLRPGSAVVAPGTRVKAGDTLAEVGFSGSASDPQLHFALTDGPDELASEGIAYVFDRYRLLGRFGEVSLIGSALWTPAETHAEVRASMPAGMSVLQWPE